MKRAQIVNTKDVQIVSQIADVAKITKDVTLPPFGKMKARGVNKVSNHYKHGNVTINDLPNEQDCKDATVVHQIQILRPGSNKITVILPNLSC